jgi:two-component system, LytTR family, sensor kinase
MLAMDGPSFKSRWLWIAAIYSGIALFDATQTVVVMRAEGMHHAWISLFLTITFEWVPWALATPLIIRLGRKYPLSGWRRFSSWSVHAAACSGIGFVSSGWTAWMEIMLNPWANSPRPDSFPSLLAKNFSNGILYYVILYALVLLVGYMLDSREQFARQQAESARLSEQLVKAQLEALRRQIEPHFLFNTLNAIAGLVREKNNDVAVNMIVELSDFLRRVVSASDQQKVPLSEELAFAQKYLGIQKIRFADRLQFSVEVPPDLFSARVPILILQPMVENAVKHGVAKRVYGGTIRITAASTDGTLMLGVYNDGPALSLPWQENHHGVGISNVHTRLKNLYGNSFEFHLRNCNSQGVEAVLSLPLSFEN